MVRAFYHCASLSVKYLLLGLFILSSWNQTQLVIMYLDFIHKIYSEIHVEKRVNIQLWTLIKMSEPTPCLNSSRQLVKNTLKKESLLLSCPKKYINGNEGQVKKFKWPVVNVVLVGGGGELPMITMIGGLKASRWRPYTLVTTTQNKTSVSQLVRRHLRMRRSHCPRRHLHHLILIHRSLLLHLYSFRTAGTGAGSAGR